jgi:hypothetical protein
LFLGSGVLPVTLGAFTGGLLAVALAVFRLRVAASANWPLCRLRIGRQCAGPGVADALKRVADPHNTLAAIEFWIMGGLGTITLVKAAGLMLATLPALSFSFF